MLVGRFIAGKALFSLGMRNENFGRTEASITVCIRCAISDRVNPTFSVATSFCAQVNGAVFLYQDILLGIAVTLSVSRFTGCYAF